MFLKFKLIPLVLFLTLGFVSCNQKEAPTKPNIIIVYLDDLGYGDVSYNGATKLKTPNMDEMALARPIWIATFILTAKFPELYNNVAIQKGEFKLVGKTDFDASLQEFELYNLVEDPFEKNNLVIQNNEKATSLKAEMDQLISELGTSPNLVNPPLIKVGTLHENPVYLNRNDAGGQRGVWNQEEVYSHWKVDLQKGVYRLKFKFLKPLMGGGEMFLELGQQILKKHNSMTESDLLVWEDVSLPQGSFDFTPFYRKGRRSNYFPLWVEIERVE